MATPLTFTRLARLCYAAESSPPATISLSRAQATLQLPQNLVTSLVAEAVTAGYLMPSGADWSLTDRGTRLGREMVATVEATRDAAIDQIVRPFTDFFPTGDEDVSVGGV